MAVGQLLRSIRQFDPLTWNKTPDDLQHLGQNTVPHMACALEGAIVKIPHNPTAVLLYAGGRVG